MATTYHNDIQKLYVAYFNRPADYAGLNYYEGLLEAANGSADTMAQISADFAKSAEYTAAFEGKTNAQIVDIIYTNIFGHAADAAGNKFYADNLTAGKVTVANVVQEVAKGAQGSDLTAYNNKLTAAAAFTAALDTEAEQKGYSGDDANAVAKDFLASVTDDASLAVAVSPATLNGSVATAVAAGTEFTAAGALAQLDAASAALADYIDSVDAESADDITDAEAAAVAKVAADLGTASGSLFTSTESSTVRDALISEQKAINAADLKEAQTALTKANTALSKVAGLSAAQTTLTSANTALKAATAAETAAMADEAAKKAAFQVNNDGAVTIDSTGLKLDGKVLADIDANGKATIADDIKAADYAGLTELIASHNAAVAAGVNVDKADMNVYNAQLAVNLLDVAADDAGTFTVNGTTYDNEAALIKAIADQINATTPKTVAADAVPTVAQIQTELAVLKAADTDSSNTYENFKALVDAEEEGVSDELAAAQGTLTSANTALTAAKESAATSQEALDTAKTDFTDANAGTIKMTATGLFFTPTGGSEVQLAEIDATTHHATVVTGMDTTYPEVTGLISAYNTDADTDAAVVAKQADVTTAKDAVAAVDPLNPLAAAQVEATAEVKAVNDAIAKLAKDVAALHTAEVNAETLAGYQATYDAAAKVLEDNGYAVVTLDEDHSGAITQFAGAKSDIYVVDGNDASIAAFGLQGADSVFVGTGYTVVDGAIGAKDVKGSDTVKEIFISTNADGDAQLQIETHAYSSAVKGATGEIVTITLVGVDASTLHLGTDGIITAGTAAA